MHQFTDTVSITSLGVGQHLDLVIDLDSSLPNGESFNEIFGDEVSDLDMASAFQFYISKSPGEPVTVYIDNVRLIQCSVDINGDSAVNIDDLLEVISAWGPCPPPCPADIAPPGGNGTVNIDDLLAVISAWGACP
jgi:hypothetical protein